MLFLLSCTPNKPSFSGGNVAPTIKPLPTFGPSATPTLGPTPTSFRSGNSNLEILDDGSTRFTDYAGGYSLVFPPEWTLARINQDEYSQLMLNRALTDALLQRYLMAYQQRDENTYRVFAFDLDKRNPGIEYLTNIEIFLDNNEAITVRQARVNLSRSKVQETYIEEVLASTDTVTSAGYPVGILEYVLETRSVTAQKVRLYAKYAIFTPHDGTLLIISLGAPVEFQADVEDVIDQLIETYEEFGQ